MAKAKLSPEEVERIAGLLTTWEGVLSWELVVAKVEALLRRPFSRQSLDRHSIIKSAFQQTKKRQRNKKAKDVHPTSNNVSVEMAFALKRIDNLVAELEVMKSEQNRLFEKFATWLYNSRSRGISERDLNQPLPFVDRDASEKPKGSKGPKATRSVLVSSGGRANKRVG